MNKDNFIGLIILSLLLSLFLFKNRNNQNLNQKVDNKTENTQKLEEQRNTESDSKDILPSKNGNINLESIKSFKKNIENQDINTEIILENDEIKAYFSSIGGCITKVVLKNYKNVNNKDVVILENSNIMNFNINKSNLNTYNLTFEYDKINDEKIIFRSRDAEGGDNIVITYKLNKERPFEVEQSVFTKENNEIGYIFNDILQQQELNAKECKSKSSVNYLNVNDEVITLNSDPRNEKIEKISDAKWIAFKQKFFTTGIKIDNKIDVEIRIKDINNGILECSSLLKLKSSNNEFKINYFFGPNSYNILKQFTKSFEKNIYLGIPIVSHFNKYVVMPFSEYLSKNINGFLIILILAILLKLLLFPIGIKIYIVTQKMQLLNKIMPFLKERYKNDQQRLAIEQISLYREFGINPLSVLLYNLTQFPFIIAIYNFIPVELIFRNSHFLWCKDMSTYDSILNLNFNIPFYGDHVSLSSILMTITMLIHIIYNSKEMGQGYKINPFHLVIATFMLCVSNRFCCALNIYYVIFNIFTFISQIIFKRIIKFDDFENKINAKIRELK